MMNLLLNDRGLNIPSRAGIGLDPFVFVTYSCTNILVHIRFIQMETNEK